MPPLHLGLEIAGHLVRGELAQLLGQHQLPGEMEQQIGHLAPDRRRVSRPERLVQLVDLLDQVRPQRIPGLDPVPGAPDSGGPGPSPSRVQALNSLAFSLQGRYSTRCRDQVKSGRPGPRLARCGSRRHCVRNARRFQQLIGAPLLPMVKADAYGLGAVPVARALEAVDPWGYGVATAEEGAAAPRRAESPVRSWFSLRSIPARSRRSVPARLTPGDRRPAALDAWLAGAAGPFHVEIDTGMSRAGFRWHDEARIAALGRAAARQRRAGRGSSPISIPPTPTPRPPASRPSRFDAGAGAASVAGPPWCT